MPLADLLQGPGDKAESDSLGVAGFQATSITRKTVEANAQAPTAWLEDGSRSNDHIILEPVQQIVEGSVGDVYLQPEPIAEFVRGVNDGLGRTTTYLPRQTQAQAQKAAELTATVRDGLIAAQTAIETGGNVLDYFGRQDAGKPLGEQFIDILLAIRAARQLVPVELGGRVWENMAIIGISVTRDNQDRAIGYEITFQQLRFAELEFVDPADAFPNAGEGTNGSTESENDKGTQSGEKESILSRTGIRGILGL